MKDYSLPAFPGEYVKHPAGEVGNQVAIKEMGAGMSLRDYFAAKAMAALFSSEANPRVGTEIEPYKGTEDHRNSVARAAYALADAMLVERAH